MTTNRESVFSRRVCRVLRSQGAQVYPLMGSAWTPPGWPDKLVIHRKWRGLLELKVADGVVSKVQDHVIRTLNRTSPGCAYVCREIADNDAVEIVDPAFGQSWTCSVTELLDTLHMAQEQIYMDLRIKERSDAGETS